MSSRGEETRDEERPRPVRFSIFGQIQQQQQQSIRGRDSYSTESHLHHVSIKGKEIHRNSLSSRKMLYNIFFFSWKWWLRGWSLSRRRRIGRRRRSTTRLFRQETGTQEDNGQSYGCRAQRSSPSPRTFSDSELGHAGRQSFQWEWRFGFVFQFASIGQRTTHGAEKSARRISRLGPTIRVAENGPPIASTRSAQRHLWTVGRPTVPPTTKWW